MLAYVSRRLAFLGLFLTLAGCATGPEEANGASEADETSAAAPPHAAPPSDFDPTDATGIALTGAGYSVTLEPASARAGWEGWGVSLAWWANAVGTSSFEETYADLLFTTKDVPYLDRVLPGLGLDIVRYNVGGGGHDGDVSGLSENVPSNLPWFKNIEGYWRNWDSPDAASASWDFTRDANQRAILAAATSRGVSHVELFSNSPMWWMVDSKSNAGGDLQAWNRRDHAHYLATVAKHMREAWGVDVGSVEAFNEPSAGWWKYPGGQEGCNIRKEEQKEVLEALRDEMNQQGLGDLPIAASDENTMTAARSTYEYFKGQRTSAGQPVSDLIGKVNVHGYNGLEPWRDNGARQRLRESVGGKRLWMSEYGDNDGSGMALAQTILEDLVYLRPNAWIYWQPVEPFSGWGFVNANYPDTAGGADRGKAKWIYSKYYVMAQFTRFLREGTTLYDTSDHNTIASFDEETKTLSFVTVNYGNAQRIVYDLSNLRGVAADVSVTVTNTAGGKLFRTGHAAIEDGHLTIVAEKNSVYSLSVEVDAIPR